MPTKKSVGCHNRADFLECLAAQYLPFDGQAPPLIVTEQNALLAELFFQYLFFSPQVLDDLFVGVEQHHIADDIEDALVLSKRRR